MEAAWTRSSGCKKKKNRKIKKATQGKNIAPKKRQFLWNLKIISKNDGNYWVTSDIIHYVRMCHVDACLAFFFSFCSSLAFHFSFLFFQFHLQLLLTVSSIIFPLSCLLLFPFLLFHFFSFNFEIIFPILIHFLQFFDSRLMNFKIVLLFVIFPTIVAVL